MAFRNVHEMNLVKLVPAKSEELNSEWRVTLTRSKSLDKANAKSSRRSKGRKSTGSITFNASPKIRLKTSKSEVKHPNV